MMNQKEDKGAENLTRSKIYVILSLVMMNLLTDFTNFTKSG